MHRLIRDIHLASGLFTLVLLAVYALSAILMSHPGVLGERERISQQELEVPPGRAAGPRALAKYLMDEHGLRGELRSVSESGEGFGLRIYRTGTEHEVRYSFSDSRARVETSQAGFAGMLIHIHHAGGLWHDYPLANAWGALVGVASLALLILGGTGIYLWFKTYEERTVGLVLLVVSFGYSLTLLFLIQAAG